MEHFALLQGGLLLGMMCCTPRAGRLELGRGRRAGKGLGLLLGFVGFLVVVASAEAAASALGWV